MYEAGTIDGFLALPALQQLGVLKWHQDMKKEAEELFESAVALRELSLSSVKEKSKKDQVALKELRQMLANLRRGDAPPRCDTNYPLDNNSTSNSSNYEPPANSTPPSPLPYNTTPFTPLMLPIPSDNILPSPGTHCCPSSTPNNSRLTAQTTTAPQMRTSEDGNTGC